MPVLGEGRRRKRYPRRRKIEACFCGGKDFSENPVVAALLGKMVTGLHSFTQANVGGQGGEKNQTQPQPQNNNQNNNNNQNQTRNNNQNNYNNNNQNNNQYNNNNN